MTTADLIVLGVLFLSALIAFVRGLVREVLSIAAWLGAAAVAVLFSPEARPWVGPYVPSQDWVEPAAYVLLFVVTLVVFSIVAKVIGNAVRASAIGGIDRSLGLLFGLARGVAVLAVVYIIAGMALPVDHWPEPVLEARSLPYIHRAATWIVPLIPPEYQPQISAPPPSRQTALEGVLSPTPAGRATDSPPRR